MDDKLKYRQWTNEIFYAALALAIVVLVFRWVTAVEQNKAYTKDQAVYFQAIEMLNKDDPAIAEKLLAICAVKWPDNPQVLWPYALALYTNKEYSQAEKYMQKAETVKPGLLTDAKFLIQHAGILTANGKYTEAEFYIGKAKNLTQDPKNLEFADAILAQIKAKR